MPARVAPGGALRRGPPGDELLSTSTGILRNLSTAPGRGGQGERLRTWMDRHVLPEFLERTLPVDSAVALKCAQLHVPDPRSERDALIAATAIVHGMTVVTGNVADFGTTGAEVIDPWARS